MPKKKVQNQTSSTPQLTTADISRAATNSPALSTNEFLLGDRTFKVCDLPYDAYIEFITFLSPLIDNFLGGVSTRMGLAEYGLSDIQQFSVASLFQYCGKQLPEMACIVCRQSDPEITVDEVKELAKNPFKLAQAVLLQIQHNNIIKDFASFFGQILPLLKTVKT